MKAVSVSFLGLMTGVLASPVSQVAKRQTSCDQYGVESSGVYTVNQDLWGEANGSGSQCSNLNTVSDGNVVWSTTWSWSGDDSVKSYANGELTFDPVQLSGISSLSTTWSWSYTQTNMVGDVAYDAFLSSEASITGPKAYELMVWLAAYGGDQPVGSSVGSVTIGGTGFDLWHGTNVQSGNTVNVYSFVIDETNEDYSGDIMDFFSYLIDNEGVDSSLYLIQLQAGTEAITGTNCVFYSNSYYQGISYT